MKCIVVIGGGIAGLAAAHRVAELSRASDVTVQLLDAAPRVGGSIFTEHVGGFLVEAGPDSFVTEKPWALRLCERVGLSSRLVSTQSAHQKIYVVHDGRLVALPEGFFLLAPTRLVPFMTTPLFSWRGKLRMGAELLLPRRHDDTDESLGAFVRRRFGPEALERVVQPLLGGIYAADPEKISLAATLPRFKAIERRYRSVIWAMWAEQRRRARARELGSGARWSLFATLAGGMHELVDTLAERLPEGALRTGTAVVGLIPREQGKAWRVTVADGTAISADGVIFATPAFQTGAMLSSTVPNAANELKQIGYASTATVSLAYRGADFPKSPDGFGFVVPAVERRKIMACTFSSLKYPGRAPPDHVLLRCFVGGALQPELFDLDDSSMEHEVRNELANLLGVKVAPKFSRIWRHPESMPQYNIGHEARIRRIEAALEPFSGLALAGSAYHGIGIADCVRTGEEAAEKVVDYLKSRP